MAISPCDERFQEGLQLPDLATVESAVITSRQITAVTGPSGTGELWNFLAVAAPFPDVAFLYKRWQPSDVTDITTLPWKAVSYRNLLSGGMKMPGSSTDPVVFARQDTPGTLLTNAEEYRQTAKGLTFNLNAPSIMNQGMVLIAQYGEKLVLVPDHVYTYNSLNFAALEVGGLPATGTEINSKNIGPVLVMDEVPQTTEQIFQKDPHAVRQMAKLGAYLPLKFNDPVSPLQGVSKASLRSRNGTSEALKPQDNLVPVILETAVTGQTDPIRQWVQQPGTATPTADFATVLCSAGYTNMQCGVVYFEGVALGASIDIKVVSALEVVATGDSAWSGFMRTSPEDDDKVQKQVHAVQRRLPSGFPSSYNFLGTLLTKVAPILGGIAVDLIGKLWNRWTGQADKIATMY